MFFGTNSTWPVCWCLARSSGVDLRLDVKSKQRLLQGHSRSGGTGCPWQAYILPKLVQFQMGVLEKL